MNTLHRSLAPWLAAMAATIALATVSAGTGSDIASAAPSAKVVNAVDFRNAMRMLWEDHITWTRMYIVSAAADLPDKDAVAARLLRNQTDIGEAVGVYYGREAGDALTALLEEHIQGAVEVLAAAKAGDNTALEAANTAWYGNGDDIATFLSTANQDNWPLGTMKSEMKEHLDVTLAEATAHLQGDSAADVRAYDTVHEHILHLADTLSAGIMAQFPDQFDQSTVSEWPLRSAMRKLWEEHVQWTRFYIVGASADLPGTDETAARLMQNQTDIGNAMVPYFGQAAGSELTTLLKEHIQGAVAVVAAAKAGDNTALDAANAAWYANADEIATFLNAANPDSWPLAAMKTEMKHHLDVTLAEASAHLTGDTAADIRGYDTVHMHILRLADTLSTGILALTANAGSQAAMPAALPKTGRGAMDDGHQTLALFVLLAALGILLGARRYAPARQR